jgi:LDH2 family malate/lactate/ureidoglycolate dehydrogenase
MQPYEKHRRQIELVLTSWKMAPEHAATTADVLAYADLCGIDSHGMSMLPPYDKLRRAGLLRIEASPSVMKETPVSAIVDAGGGLGHPAGKLAMQTAIAKAKIIGMAVVVVRNTAHYGACGYYTRMAAEAGLIGMSTTTTPGVTVAPTGGAQGRLGTDPWSMSAPGEDGRPFLLDMATATVASGKVRNKANEKLPTPPGWVMTREGAPSTDPLDLLERKGYLTSLGGTPEGASHKGYGLAAMARILSAGLAGAPMLLPPEHASRPPTGSLAHFFLALDPGLFRDADDFRADVAAFCDSLRATKPVDPAKPVQVAGDPERANAARRMKEGVPVGPGLLAQVKALAQESGAEWILG